MNNELFSQARALYESKNYEGALAVFTQCLQAGGLAPGEMGLIYHRIGNCLVKAKNPAEAIQAYTQATADTAYDAVGSVNCNLGMAYAALHDYEDAVRHFEIAVSDAKYATPYKAYSGMGNALMKLGKSAEAGIAFRNAALDEANPDPTKALLNLGVCFMALNRPADAVASYESALQFSMQPETKNKLYANLGQAYVACGQMQKAVNAFETAIADKTYFLSDSASVDYQRAVGAVAQGSAEISQALPAADMSGLDVAADGTQMYSDPDATAIIDPSYYYDQEEYVEGMPEGYSAAAAEDRFFNASDEELEQWSKGLVKQERKRKGVGLKIAIVIIVLILALFGGAMFAYTQGYGFPTQEMVVQELFADPEAAADSVFANGVDEASRDAMLNLVSADSDITVDGVNKTMSNSEVFATAQTADGGEMQYKISLVRDIIGWKVSNIEFFFASQN